MRAERALTDLERRQQLEIDFWRHSATEGPDAHSIDNILNKIGDAEVFLDLIERYQVHL